jgi:hypothetical protein
VVKIRMMAVAALALAAACGGTTPPEDGPAPGGRGGPGGTGGPMMSGMGGGGPNVFALIGAREQLSLSGAQVTELDSIGRAWSVLNDSLQRQLRGRRGDRTPMEEVRPLLLRMAANNESANRAVETLLSDEQRRMACALPAAQGEARRRPPPGAPMPGGRPGGARRPRSQRMPGDTMPGMRMSRGWPWCAPTVPADSAR